MRTLRESKVSSRKDLGNGGWIAEHQTNYGLISQTMLNYGVHDRLMAYAVTISAVLEAFQVADPDFAPNEEQRETL